MNNFIVSLTLYTRMRLIYVIKKELINIYKMSLEPQAFFTLDSREKNSIYWHRGYLSSERVSVLFLLHQIYLKIISGLSIHGLFPSGAVSLAPLDEKNGAVNSFRVWWTSGCRVPGLLFLSPASLGCPECIWKGPCVPACPYRAAPEAGLRLQSAS